jgi:hypothetical protein
MSAAASACTNLSAGHSFWWDAVSRQEVALTLF